MSLGRVMGFNRVLLRYEEGEFLGIVVLRRCEGVKEPEGKLKISQASFV